MPIQAYGSLQQNLGEHDDTADVHYRRNRKQRLRERFTTDYDLPNSTNYSETCASIGVMMFGQRMAAITEMLLIMTM